MKLISSLNKFSINLRLNRDFRRMIWKLIRSTCKAGGQVVLVTSSQHEIGLVICFQTSTRDGCFDKLVRERKLTLKAWSMEKGNEGENATFSSLTFSSPLQTLIFLFLPNLTGRRRTRNKDPENRIVTWRYLNSREIPLSDERALPPSVPSPHPSFVSSLHSPVRFVTVSQCLKSLLSSTGLAIKTVLVNPPRLTMKWLIFLVR